jgi:ribosome recycling factor
MVADDKGIEDVDVRFKTLLKRKETVQQSKVQVEAELSARKRALKEAMEACKKAGYDPDNLQDEISRAKEVLAIKLDNFSADIDAAEAAMRPMLKEIG